MRKAQNGGGIEHSRDLAWCRTLMTVLLIGCLSACGGGGSQEVQAGASPGWTAYERSDEFPSTVTTTGVTIRMRDGVLLSANVMHPADAAGQVASGRFPVILTQTGYNKSLPFFVTVNPYFVTHGYVHVSVDVRGTGESQGNWEAFSETEQDDYKDVLDWIVQQPWCNGSIGTWGASFAGITQLFTAKHQHPAHKAVFAIVPMGDAYRDIVFSGGQLNAGFIPVWMGLVTGLGVVSTEPSAQSTEVIAQHIVSAVTDFQVPVIAESALGVDGMNYDGDFWVTRSPLAIANRIRTPTFIVGGLNDLFQRGEPLIYEALKRQTDAKLLIGPWTHIDASKGAGLPRDGVPDLNHIALQWFDHYLRGMDNGAQAVPNVTQYLYGEERYVTSPDWPHPQAHAQRWYLHGDATLSQQPPLSGEHSISTVQDPLQGICSESTAQWTAGVLGDVPLACFQGSDNFNELVEIAYSTPVMDQDYYINGPIESDIWLSTTARDAGLVTRITDVAPDGTSHEITNGIQTASLRAVDPLQSRFMDGQMIQPWHPYTQDSRQPFNPGDLVQVPVEVFPTSVVIKKGHRLRVAVGASDFPHGLPPLPDLVNQLAGVLTIHSDAAHPSSIVVPVVPMTAIPTAGS